MNPLGLRSDVNGTSGSVLHPEAGSCESSNKIDRKRGANTHGLSAEYDGQKEEYIPLEKRIAEEIDVLGKKIESNWFSSAPGIQGKTEKDQITGAKDGTPASCFSSTVSITSESSLPVSQDATIPSSQHALPVYAAVVGTGEKFLKPEAAAEHLRKIMKEINIIGFLEQREEILIDFILFEEKLVHDRKFTDQNSPEKYVSNKTISKKRIEEIKEILKRAKRHHRQTNSLTGISKFSLILADYLSKKKGIQDDVTINRYRSSAGDHYYFCSYENVLHDIFLFSEKILADECYFSEFFLIFNFAVKYRQDLVDSYSSKSHHCCINVITRGLRINKDMRECFNKDVMDVIFERRYKEIIDAMFEGGSLPIDSRAKTKSELKLKFGEEFECDVFDERCKYRSREGNAVDIFVERIKEKGAREKANDSKWYAFSNNFAVKPFFDSNIWFEINCTPYDCGDEQAESCFENVFAIIDSMRNEGKIGYSSGHKHVDAQSATQGDTGVLLVLDGELQRNPYLLRAFGNNDRILNDNECEWYKTFADYNPGAKSFAIKRLNMMIDYYNEKMREKGSDKQDNEEITDLEKKNKLEKFANFYSQFVHMSTIQEGHGNTDSDCMEKYMAMSLMHIIGTKNIQKLSTLEFRFFRCPKNVNEVLLINQFLQAWFKYIHKIRQDRTPLTRIPEDIKPCTDYTAEEVRNETGKYLQKLGLELEEYTCFLDVEDMPAEAVVESDEPVADPDVVKSEPDDAKSSTF